MCAADVEQMMLMVHIRIKNWNSLGELTKQAGVVPPFLETGSDPAAGPQK